MKFNIGDTEVYAPLLGPAKKVTATQVGNKLLRLDESSNQCWDCELPNIRISINRKPSQKRVEESSKKRRSTDPLSSTKSRKSEDEK